MPPFIGEVVRIDEPIHAWNVDGSSSAIPSSSSSSSSWIAEAEARTGRKRGRCSYEGCGRLADVGGHVWVARRGVFIAPICHGCNHYDNARRMQDAHARLRGGIEITRAEFTEDMRVSERRFCSPPGTPRKRACRECCACGVDVSDRPEGHDLCYDCYRRRRLDGGGSGGGGGGRGRRTLSSSSASRARRRRPCERCGEDISERPSTHFLCLSCYHRNRS
jgi:hypothetical protein